MNIVVPMAGEGKRFVEQGFTDPKPLLRINNKSMIQLSIESLNLDGNYTFIVRSEHNKRYGLSSYLKSLVGQCNIIEVNKTTEGAACTVLLAERFINNSNPLMIVNSDQYIRWNSSNFLEEMSLDYLDGCILSFANNSPKWSYLLLDDNNLVTKVVEKEVVSDLATVGIYFWKKGNEFVKSTQKMITKNIRTKGEFYVAPSYNEMIGEGKIVGHYPVDEMYGTGTPEDWKRFVSDFSKIV